MRLSPAMKAAVSARLAEAGWLRSARRSPDASAIRKTRRERPVTSATASPPKRCRIWSSAACTGGNAASFSINASLAATVFLAQDRVALGVGHGPRHEIALVVGERLLQLHRECVRQIFQARLPRCQVDGDGVPFRDRDIGDAPVQQSLAGGDQLDDAGMTCLEIGFHRTGSARGISWR